MDLVFLKLGGSAITDKSSEATARPDALRRAAREIKQAREFDQELRIVLGHGSGSFGHFAAKRYGFGEADNWHAFVETGAAAARLNRIATDILLEEGVPVLSLQPSASAACRDGEIVSLAEGPLRQALEHNLVPLIYGDIAFDASRGMSIISTEQLFAYLVPLLHPGRIVYVTAVNGIYSGDPTTSPHAELIPEITPDSFAEIEAGVGAASGFDVTGGMLDKVGRNLALVRQLRHLEVYVIGMQEGLIRRALTEENFGEGTWIHAGAISGD